MRVRKTLVAACAALSAAGIAASVASADKYLIPDASGVILGNGGGFVIGSDPGRELNGGICNKNGAFMPGYYYGYISVSNPPGNFDSDNDCPQTDEFPPSSPPDPPVDPNNPPDPPSAGGGAGPQGYAAFDDPSGAVFGDEGGIVVGNNPGGRGYELGICQRNEAGPQGYAYGAVSSSGPGTGTSEGCPIHRPTVKAREATAVTDTTATINGVVNGNYKQTTYHFEVGDSTGYTSQSSERQLRYADRDTFVTLNISGGQPNTTYHYRVVATNSAGTTYGPDVSFTTTP